MRAGVGLIRLLLAAVTLASAALAAAEAAVPASPPTRFDLPHADARAVGKDGARGAVGIVVTPAEAPEILTAVRAKNADAVLVNVWATWCEACLEEMPELGRLFRAHRNAGLRLVTVSADEEEQREAVARLLAQAGLTGPAFIKRGDDAVFINALEPRWSGALPFTILFDGSGRTRQFWPRPVTYDELERAVLPLLRKSKDRRK